MVLFTENLVLSIHLAFVAFIVVGLVLIIFGALRSWIWVRNPWFRLAHLLGIVVVASQAWMGIVCPLTTLELRLRASAGGATYAGTFVSHWMQRMLYFSAPDWVFAFAYSTFGAMVLVSWFAIRPGPFRE
jgi:hypothetical protein